MKPPKDADTVTLQWFKLTAKSQRESISMFHAYRMQGFKDDLRIRFRRRLEVLRNGGI